MHVSCGLATLRRLLQLDVKQRQRGFEVSLLGWSPTHFYYLFAHARLNLFTAVWFVKAKYEGLPWWSSAPNAGGLGLISDQGNRSHIPRLTQHTAATKTRYSSINK